MAPRQVTVFGGSGFIGRHLVHRLAAAGCRVVAAVRRPEAADFLRPMGDVGQVVPLRCDVRDAAAVARALEGADAAVNLVGILFETRRRRFADLHGAAPGIIAGAVAARGLGAFVQVSAIGADPHAPSAYGRTKAQGEAAAREGFGGTTVMRPSVVFGPEDDFFNRFAALARVSPVLPLFGGGTNLFQPVYVCDVAEAIWQALSRRGARGRTFELGGPKVYSFHEIMALILAEIGRRRLLVPLPMAVADVIGLGGDVLAALGVTPPLTRDQARLLRTDNVVAEGAAGLAELGIRPTAAELILPTYLDRFRPAGRFGPVGS
jgi:NADH dehydrogenase